MRQEGRPTMSQAAMHAKIYFHRFLLLMRSFLFSFLSSFYPSFSPFSLPFPFFVSPKRKAAEGKRERERERQRTYMEGRRGRRSE